MLATDLANYILKNAGKRLSNLELQRYLYIVEIEYIKKFNKHLIDDDFVAWVYGPIAEDVYWKYRDYGANSIKIPKYEEVEKVLNQLNDDKQNNIKASIKYCDNKTYYELVEITNNESGAWYKTFEDKKRYAIDKKLIFKEAKSVGGV